MRHTKTSYKLISLALCLAMLLPLAGCGESKQEQAEIFAMDTYMVITAEGGMCGTYVKTAGKRGHARLVISAPQTESVTLEFEIDKENNI